MVVPNIQLPNKILMPALGYGTWQAQEGLKEAIEAALEVGYRHIDTAHVYGNEKIIGDVLKKWISAGKIKREDLFIATKLPPGGNYAEGVPKYLTRSLQLLQLDYVDLYLIHCPFQFRDVEGDLHPKKPDGEIDIVLDTDHLALWKAMEEQVDKGLCRSIGLSNFNRRQIERILNAPCRIRPANLQIEIQPYFQQNALVEFCRQERISVTAYSPLGTPGLAQFVANFTGQKLDLPDVLGNPTILQIGKKYGKSAAQVVLKFAVQRGLNVIPKSTNRRRLTENFTIFDFDLDAEDLTQLKGLDQGLRIVNFAIFKGIEKHPEFPF